MNKEDLAEIIDGIECLQRFEPEIIQVAKDSGLVIVMGGSDDRMEFEGVLLDEISCYGGGIAYMTKSGTIENGCQDDNCPYFKALRDACKTIEAIWNSEGYSWIYKTDIPHVTFTVLEDEGKYCRGIVFSIEDL